MKTHHSAALKCNEFRCNHALWLIFFFLFLTPRFSFSQYVGHGDKYIDTTTPYMAKNNVVSFGFFSPLNQHLSFGYDRFLNKDMVFTSQLGIIGPGLNPSATSETISTLPSPYGGFLEAGIKLFLQPNYYNNGKFRYPVMEGMYLKPQMILSIFNQSYYYYNYIYYPPYTNTQQTGSYNFTGCAIMLNLGGQWLLANTLVIDMYAGIGYTFINYAPYSTNNSNPSDNGNYYSFIISSPWYPLAFDAGINIGVPF